MLVLSRKIGEGFQAGGVVVQVLESTRTTVRLGIAAPADIRVTRLNPFEADNAVSGKALTLPTVKVRRMEDGQFEASAMNASGSRWSTTGKDIDAAIRETCRRSQPPASVVNPSDFIIQYIPAN